MKRKEGIFLFVVNFQLKNEKKRYPSKTEPVIVSYHGLNHIWIDGGQRCIEAPKKYYLGYKSAQNYSKNTNKG